MEIRLKGRFYVIEEITRSYTFTKRCLRWDGGGGVGVIKESFKKHPKIGMGKDKSCS